MTACVLTFAKVTDDGVVEPFEWNDVVGWNASQGMYNRFHRHVRGQNPAIKTLISIGGWNFGSTVFSPLVSTAGSGGGYPFPMLVAI